MTIEQVEGEQLHYRMLDHGYVKYVAHLGDDNSPLEGARMSTGRETGVDVVADDRLRARLWRDQHTSPFQLCELVVEMQLPIFCLRQIDRHRTIARDELAVDSSGRYSAVESTVESCDPTMHAYTARNEFSGRYSAMPDLFYIPVPSRIQRKGAANKQGSAGPLPVAQQVGFVAAWMDAAAEDRLLYEKAINAGMASELARLHLPLNQYTKVRLKADLLNWLKFLQLRLQPDVQWETRQYAQAVGKIIKDLWPKTWAVFEEQLYGARLSRTEWQTVRCVLEEFVSDSGPGEPGPITDLLRRLDGHDDLLEAP